jgi:hypothetical protein
VNTTGTSVDVVVETLTPEAGDVIAIDGTPPSPAVLPFEELHAIGARPARPRTRSIFIGKTPVEGLKLGAVPDLLARMFCRARNSARRKPAGIAGGFVAGPDGGAG